MYLSIPDVMRFALNVTDDQPDSFKSDLNKLTRANWITAGESDLQLENYQRATKRFIRADLMGSDKETTELLDQCRPELADYDSVKSDAKSDFDNLIQTIADSTDDNANDGASSVTAEAEPR